MGKSKVFFTKEITAESLIKIYNALGVELPGKVGVKVSTGEKGAKGYLKEEIIGQDKAVEEAIKVATKIKLGYTNGCSSLLLVGQSGVGKTMLANTLSKCMNMPLLRLDMSEYTESHSVSKIIGSPPGYVGYSDHKYILDQIRLKPYTILLLDEIEKAHPSIINLFLQILDNNKIKDSMGNTIRFDKNAFKFNNLL